MVVIQKHKTAPAGL